MVIGADGPPNVFDELKQTVKDIELLADPKVGEVRIGCPESISSGILRPIIHKFSLQYPRAVLHVDDVVTPPLLDFPALRERKVDLIFARLVKPLGASPFEDDLCVETLFNDELAIATTSRSRWTARRKIDLAELVNEPWILTGQDTWLFAALAEAFRERSLEMPTLSLVSFSVHLRANLLADADVLTAFPKSFLHFNADRFSLKVLPIALEGRPWRSRS